ncbi:nucleotide-binding protein [Microbacterium halophytorum]|uniref:nucleotide-binding protein n=1 Tax=Microbacterium halophytorum TaxID=2067568 RepID=UPI001E58751C|nr:AAA family ATPase [Microbacterium halophytorum]
MARHEKHSDESVEDHGLLDAPVVETTALNLSGLPTEQVNLTLPRGYQDLDDEDDDDVVDDSPDGFASGSIVLELPGAAHRGADDAAAGSGAPGEPGGAVEAADEPADQTDGGAGAPRGAGDAERAPHGAGDEAEGDADEVGDAGESDDAESGDAEDESGDVDEPDDAADDSPGDAGGSGDVDDEWGDAEDDAAEGDDRADAAAVDADDLHEQGGAEEGDEAAEPRDDADDAAIGTGEGEEPGDAADGAALGADEPDGADGAEKAPDEHADEAAPSGDGAEDSGEIDRAADAPGDLPAEDDAVASGTGGADEAADAEAADRMTDTADGAAPTGETDAADDEAARRHALTAGERQNDTAGADAPVTTDDATEAERMADGNKAEAGGARFLSQQARQSSGGESASLLTSDRLIEPVRSKRKPEGAWRGFWYSVSGGLINLGDSKRVRERKETLTRIAAPLPGRARFVPVLSRKGGVGKTTVTTLLGMALADARDDRVIAVDANPDRGTLAERTANRTNRTVRDVVRRHDKIRGYADISDLVARDATRLDIVASETDPHVADAFDASDYRTVAEVASQYYSLVLTDTGTGIIHSVMGATLDMADQLVVVAGPSVDEARLASETLTWLEAHGRADLVRGAVVVLNQSAPGRSLVRLDELESHFSSRVRAVVRLPYDEALATGGAIVFGDLNGATRDAAREAAAHLIEGMRSAAMHSVGDDA